MVNNILVVLTPQHQGLAPLKHAIKIKRGIEDTSLRLLYVIPRTQVLAPGPPPPPGAFIPIRLRDSRLYQDSLKAASSRLDELEDVCRNSAVTCTSRILIGRRGYLTAEAASLCHVAVCEKRPEKLHIDGRYRQISLSEIARLARTPVLAIPKNYVDIATVQTIYDDSLKSHLLLGFSMHLAQVLDITLRIVLVDGPECRAEDLKEKTAALLADYVAGTESEIVVAGKAKRVIEQFGTEKATMTTINSGWYMNLKHFRLSRNKVVHAFKGPVAIVP